MAGGTEAFPDMGMHCQHTECNQLDFLPFKCDSCRKVFCLEHRSYKSHDCPKSDRDSRKVVVCEICSSAIETTGRDGEEETAILERHEKSGDCDPKKKKKKPRCPVRRCREVLTFSNTSTCKSCQVKVCLKHRFPGDHACERNSSANLGRTGRGLDSKFLIALASRNANSNANDCAKEGRRGSASPPAAQSVKAS
ncbi:Zinc finger AN1 domain-containing stress-associated protein 12 [Sarracenia purpurea var. burkii]